VITQEYDVFKKNSQAYFIRTQKLVTIEILIGIYTNCFELSSHLIGSRPA